MEIGIFFAVAGNFYYDRKKKRYSRLSGGCAIIITTGKKRYIRLSVGCAVLAIMTGKKKIQSSVWRVVLLYQFLVLAGNWHFFVVAGNFHYNRKKKNAVVCLEGA